MSDISGNAAAIGNANTTQMSAALIVQTYANSVLEQPDVDFSGIDGLSQFQKQINDGLTTAQGHANYYLDTLQPEVIANMANISNYYELNDAIPATLPAGSTVAEWTSVLNAVQQQSQTYQTAAKQVVTDLQNFGSELATDSASFTNIVDELNAKVGGDSGVLAGIKNELSKTQSEIDGAIAGIAVSSLTIAGGVFVICVGAIADFVTAGTSTGAVVGGVGMVAAGAGGEAASIVTLINANNEKAALLNEEAKLTTEVKLAAAVSSGYASLSTQVNSAITAATAMADAWESVDSDIADIISDLNEGITSTDVVRTLFVNAANGEIKTLLADIQIVKQQMAGVTVQTASSKQTVSQLISSVAKQSALALA